MQQIFQKLQGVTIGELIKQVSHVNANGHHEKFNADPEAGAAGDHIAATAEPRIEFSKKRVKTPKNEIKTQCVHCGTWFTSRTFKGKPKSHCSQKCYNRDYYDSHRPKKEPAPVSDNADPADHPAISEAKSLLASAGKKALDEKLKQITETCPKPTARPNIARHFDN